jgi:hypothetical protein
MSAHERDAHDYTTEMCGQTLNKLKPKQSAPQRWINYWYEAIAVFLQDSSPPFRIPKIERCRQPRYCLFVRSVAR